MTNATDRAGALATARSQKSEHIVHVKLEVPQGMSASLNMKDANIAAANGGINVKVTTENSR